MRFPAFAELVHSFGADADYFRHTADFPDNLAVDFGFGNPGCLGYFVDQHPRVGVRVQAALLPPLLNPHPHVVVFKLRKLLAEVVLQLKDKALFASKGKG